ncbi:pygopus homolog 2-like [Aedes albopictus]|uniref:PHD-type domain-containing protein n=1 Tax=Aedes albopictus TaxID=7160 RepID=A0ABM1XSB1_AEDAL
MENKTECRKCHRDISDCEARVVCRGDCAGMFHSKCVGLEKEILDAIAESENVVWMCEPCVDWFRAFREVVIKMLHVQQSNGQAQSK